jgi:hypothetical protein
MTFLFCECPDCQYSVVVRASDLGSDKLACPLCWQDNQRLVAMTSRPALDTDQPEDLDVRKQPAGGALFTCSSCGRSCMSRWSEADAQAEFELQYGRPADPDQHPAICDDCHTKLVVKGHA